LTRCVITNKQSLFVRKLTSDQVKVNIIDASAKKCQYKVTICLELIDDKNVKHTYNIPSAIYNQHLNFDLFGIPKLAAFFNNKDYIPSNNVDCDGTTIKSSGCCLRLVWDHGKHIRHFTHGDSTLPEILLYPGHGYFSAFCLRLKKCYDDSIAFAFSSSFFISPSHDKTAALVSDNEESNNKSSADSLCRTQTNGYDDTLDSKGE
jgi:hypothetical protein